jgi:(2Fe-2S) ferredoxin
MNSKSYRVFVCTKKRHPGDPEGSCCHFGAMEIYKQFQKEIQKYNLTDQVQIRSSGCLDRCEAGPVVLICQPKKAELSWLPLKVRMKLKKLLFSNKSFYGGIKTVDVPAIVESHLLKGKPLKKYRI